ncbi:MAG: AzlD domain-containing protein [Micromonosporaceae bacterium]
MSLLEAVLILAAGTYAFRLAGPLLRDRIELSEPAQEWLTLPAVALLAALVATSTLFSAEDFGGWARVIGVSVGGVAALLRAPFVVTVVAAAVATAGLRALGLP